MMEENLEIEDILTESLSSTITTTSTTTTSKTTSTLVPEPLEQDTEIIINPAVMTEIPIINDKEYTTIETREKSEALQTTIAPVQSEEIITKNEIKEELIEKFDIIEHTIQFV